MKEQREKDAVEAVEEIVKKFGPVELDAERIRRIKDAEKDALATVAGPGSCPAPGSSRRFTAGVDQPEGSAFRRGRWLTPFQTAFPPPG